MEANAERIEWLGPRAQVHAEVVQALFGTRTIIPLKFGTLFYTEERVREVLCADKDRIRGALSKLAGQEEWGVKFYGHLENLAQVLVEQELAAKGGPATPPGQGYLLRKRLATAFRDRTRAILEEEVQLRFEQLKVLSSSAYM